MFKKLSFLLALIPIIGLVVLMVVLTEGHTFAILDTKGAIAQQQKSLLLFAFILSLFVIIPVFMLTIFIAWRYRAGNSKAAYRPTWNHSRRLETIWWGIPCVIILVLSVVTWQTSHSLDPMRPIASTAEPMTIQVVALQWKWLFIYPEQDIATVNHVRLPVGTPVTFEITSDAPMNSFWIPQLGGQVYAMSGMSTRLNLIADQAGTYAGSSANISGEGFSKMRFDAVATDRTLFDDWMRQVKSSSTILSNASYQTLAQPSADTVPATFSSIEHNLYDTIIMKYMSSGEHQSSAEKNGDNGNNAHGHEY